MRWSGFVNFESVSLKLGSADTKSYFKVLPDVLTCTNICTCMHILHLPLQLHEKALVWGMSAQVTFMRCYLLHSYMVWELLKKSRRFRGHYCGIFL